MPDAKRLQRSSTDKVIAGVCGGLGEYFEVDSIVFRLIFVLLVIFGGSGIIIYLIMWILIPESGETRTGDFGEDLKKGTSKMAKELRETSRENNNARLIGGLLIVLLGVVFLLQEFFPMWRIGFDRLWPLLLIAFGVAILIRSERAKEETEQKEKTENKTKEKK